MPKRKVFVSFYQGDRLEVDAFLNRWAYHDGLFTPRVLGVSGNDAFINSTNTEYVMNRIRQLYLGDSTVTMVLVGPCTHSRRYVDWEINTFLRQSTYMPNGLLGIILPSQDTSAALPQRFQENWSQDHHNCYARYWVAPATAPRLTTLIEDAYDARTTRTHLIHNSSDMMRYNRRCQACRITH